MIEVVRLAMRAALFDGPPAIGVNWTAPGNEAPLAKKETVPVGAAPLLTVNTVVAIVNSFPVPVLAGTELFVKLVAAFVIVMDWV